MIVDIDCIVSKCQADREPHGPHPVVMLLVSLTSQARVPEPSSRDRAERRGGGAGAQEPNRSKIIEINWKMHVLLILVVGTRCVIQICSMNPAT